MVNHYKVFDKTKRDFGNKSLVHLNLSTWTKGRSLLIALINNEDVDIHVANWTKWKLYATKDVKSIQR